MFVRYANIQAVESTVGQLFQSKRTKRIKSLKNWFIHMYNKHFEGNSFSNGTTQNHETVGQSLAAYFCIIFS